MTEYISLVDGRRAGVLEVTDATVLRGDGVFEAVRAYRGRPFRLADHLDRLERSAEALRIDVPDRTDIEAWIARVATAGGDCIVRIVVTRGSAVPGVDGTPRCVVLAHPVPPPPAELALLPLSAPWHPGGRAWDLAGAKTVSYAPNMAASRRAHEAGFDDALLLSDDGIVLEGPTFSVGWVRRGVVGMPPTDLGVLDSITRRVVVELADHVLQEAITLEELSAMDEVFAMSTAKEVRAVRRVGAVTFPDGPVVAGLAQRVAALARADEGH